MILQSLAGLPAFLVYFCTAIVAVVAYLFIYTRVTPHDEFQLIRDNDPAAAIALGSGHVALLLMGSFAIGGGVYRLMAIEKFENRAGGGGPSGPQNHAEYPPPGSLFSRRLL